MKDQPEINGHEQAPKVSASQTAYVEAANNLAQACAMAVSSQVHGLGMPQNLQMMLVYLNGALRLREVEIRALLEILEEQKLATFDQWFDRTAASAEKCAAMILDEIEKLENAKPAILLASGKVPRNRQ